jgi:hypothetical protein
MARQSSRTLVVVSRTVLPLDLFGMQRSRGCRYKLCVSGPPACSWSLPGSSLEAPSSKEPREILALVSHMSAELADTNV